MVTEHSEKRKSAKQLKTRSNKGILISKSPDRKGSEWNHRGKFSFFLPVPLQVMLGNRFSWHNLNLIRWVKESLLYIIRGVISRLVVILKKELWKNLEFESWLLNLSTKIKIMITDPALFCFDWPTVLDLLFRQENISKLSAEANLSKPSHGVAG